MTATKEKTDKTMKAEKVQSPYDLFRTDEALEADGVDINYGPFSIKIARAGGGNKRYAKVLEAKSRPYRRQMQLGTLDEAIDRKILIEVYAETVILGWSNVTDREGKPLAFNKANVIQLMTDLPDMFSDITVQANRIATFKNSDAEDDAGN